MTSKITCLVTVHGIGFERPPRNDQPGYADALQRHLGQTKYLAGRLSEHMLYVESNWCHPRKPGNQTIRIDEIAAKLPSDKEIVHIPLVYSDLETRGPHFTATLATCEMVGLAASRYSSIAGLFDMAIADGLAVLKDSLVVKPCGDEPLPPGSWNPRSWFRPPRVFSSTLAPAATRYQSLCPRTDLPFDHHPACAADSSLLAQTIRNLKDDVACYVCINEERERVRSFVRDVITELVAIETVERIVLNSHSNGTVVAFDVLHTLPQAVLARVPITFVTAGSPLRKYVDLFHWGRSIQSHYDFRDWHNFYDRLDPVADPLNPLVKPSDTDKVTNGANSETLFQSVNLQKGTTTPIRVLDIPVDNVQDSCGGGLQAHNYWDNLDVVNRLAALL